jgi:DNA topoisomerase IB
MARLRRSACTEPGIGRRRRGRGFHYLGPDGTRLTDTEAIARVESLVIPPAWQDVWICVSPHGHLQAVGTDTAGRRQYLYHPQWRERQDRAKFDRILTFARALPPARLAVAEALAAEGFGRERVLAAAFRMLDLGLFRVGGEGYAKDNGSYGLATLRRDHVRVALPNEMFFCYVGKSGQEHESKLVDDDLAPVVRRLKNRRAGGPELLAYQEADGRWRDVTSSDVNDYVKAMVGADYSAKDFRTWHATVLAAVGLAVSAPAAERAHSARQRAVARVVREVADRLGNTPAVCRSSYIDPRVIDRFHGGETIAHVLEDLAGPPRPEGHVAIEQAVLKLLDEEA